jgi:hypothetical protein
MGMDVVGNNPTTEAGEYFRNNVWWWRPLWNYCREVSPEARSVEYGQSNDGDGLNADDAIKLGKTLLVKIEVGHTAKYEADYNKELSELPRVDCDLCGKTGIRSDEIGVEYGMPTKELDSVQASVLGRTHGWCNKCSGVGTVEHSGTHYPFSVDNVQEFANFVIASGGFSIC